MNRFFLSREDTVGEKEIVLTGENYIHLTRALRARIGEECVVCDGACTDYLCRVAAADKQTVTLTVERTEKTAGESDISITLYQCLPKGDKMESVISRAVEAGITRIVPVVSRNCVARPERIDKKTERWNRIAASSAGQCGRGILPRVTEIKDLGEALSMLSAHQTAFVCYENETKRRISDIPLSGDIGFLIGPEGGLAPEEAAVWEAAGLPAVTLGRRILRTENAAAFVLPILHYLNGEV